jgi:hypothetical protein
MKKLVGIFSIAIIILFGCQEATSVVAPNNDDHLDKKVEQEEFSLSEIDTIYGFDSGKPIIPRM